MQKHHQNLQPQKSQWLLEQNNFQNLLVENVERSSLQERSLIDIGWEKLEDSTWGRFKNWINGHVDKKILEVTRSFEGVIIKNGFRALGILSKSGKITHAQVVEGQRLFKLLKEKSKECVEKQKEFTIQVMKKGLFSEDQQEKIWKAINIVEQDANVTPAGFIKFLERLRKTGNSEIRRATFALESDFKEMHATRTQVLQIYRLLNNRYLRPYRVEIKELDEIIKDIGYFGSPESGNKQNNSSKNQSKPKTGKGTGTSRINPAEARFERPADYDREQTQFIYTWIRGEAETRKNDVGLQKDLQKWTRAMQKRNSERPE